MPPRAMPATTVSSASAPAASLNSVNWPMARTVSARPGGDEDRGEHRPAELRVRRRRPLLPAPRRDGEQRRGRRRGVLAEPERRDARATSAIAGLTCQRLSARPPATDPGREPARERPPPTPTATADGGGRAHQPRRAPPCAEGPCGGAARSGHERGTAERPRRARAAGRPRGGRGEARAPRRAAARRAGRPPAQRPRRTGGGATEQDDSGELARHVRAILSASAHPERHSARVARCATAAGKERALGRAPELAAMRAFLGDGPAAARAGADGRARDRQDDAVGGGRRARRRDGRATASCRARPSGTEAGLPFAALIDVCEPLGDARARRASPRRSGARSRPRSCARAPGARRRSRRRSRSACATRSAPAAARRARAGRRRRRAVARRRRPRTRSPSPRGGCARTR